MGPDATKRRLDQKFVDRQRGRPGERVVIWDTIVRGLGLRLYEHRASYVLRYKPRGKAQVMTTLGDARVLTLADARSKAETLRGEGVVTKRAISVSALLDHYEANHRTRKKGRTPAEDRDSVRRCKMLRERWGARRADDVTHIDVSSLLAEITKRGAPYEANRTRALIRTVWGLARRWGFVPAAMINPTDGTPLNRERARDVQALKPNELARLLAAAERYPNPWAAGLIRLSALTGCRFGELRKLRWADVDVRQRMMVLRDRKGGDDLALPLSEAAANVLSTLPRQKDSPWIFPSKDPAKHIVDVRKPWEQVLADAELPKDTRVHDMRAAVATNVEREAGLKVAKLVLGHADERTTMRYVRPAADDVRRAIEAHGRAVTPATMTKRRKAAAK